MVRTRSRSRSLSRSSSRSRSRERIDKFGRVIPPGKKRSTSRSRSRDRYRRRTRSPDWRRRYRSRSRSRSRDSRHSSRRGDSLSRSSRLLREKEVTNRTNIEDPEFLNARIFIGKLPSDRCTKEDLEGLFESYGKILGVSIHDRGFGFVQFEKEEDARKAQEAENGTKFKGQVLDIKMAAEGRKGPGGGRGASERGGSRGPGPSRDFDREPGGYPGREGRGPPPPSGRDRSPVRGEPYEDRFRDPYARREPPPRDSADRSGPPPPPPRDDPYYADPYRRLPPPDDLYRDPYRDDPYRRDPFRRDPYDDPFRDPYYRDPYLPPPPPPKKAFPADVQIICMNKQLIQYAESIEARLRQHALIIDIVIIPEDLTLPQMVEEAARLKFLFAIIINSQNETHKSLTLNILHGTPQEHRNMPLEDAMKLVASSFEKYIQTQREKAAAPPAGVPSAAPAAGAPPFLPPSADIAYLLNLLADNRQLTIEELGKVIDYLKERKDKLMLSEGVHPPVESPASQRTVPTGVQAPVASAGDSTSAFLQQQQQELQNKILNILNGSGSSAQNANPPQGIQAQAGYSGLAGASGRSQSNMSGSSPLINFDNPNVQKALDNLIQSGPSLLKSLPSTVTQSTGPRLSQYQAGNQQATSGRQSASYPGQQAQQGGQGSQAAYGGGQYGQFQQQSPLQGQAAPRGAPQAGYGGQQQRSQMMGARTPQQNVRPRY